jgi:hypothetical protein
MGQSLFDAPAQCARRNGQIRATLHGCGIPGRKARLGETATNTASPPHHCPAAVPWNNGRGSTFRHPFGREAAPMIRANHVGDIAQHGNLAFLRQEEGDSRFNKFIER